MKLKDGLWKKIEPVKEHNKWFMKGWTKRVLCLSEELIIILEQRTSLGNGDINLKHWTIYLASNFFFFFKDSIPLFFLLLFLSFSISPSRFCSKSVLFIYFIFYYSKCNFSYNCCVWIISFWGVNLKEKN